MTLRLQVWMRELRRMVGKVTSKADHVELRADKDLKANPDGLYLPLIQCSECHTTGWLSRLPPASQKLSTRLDEIYNNWFSGRSEAVRLYAGADWPRPYVDGVLQPTFFATFMPPMTRGKVTVPTGCGSFPSQFDNRGLPINRNPALARKSAETRYNVVHQTIAEKGGHFPALEQPQAWMDDLRTFVRGIAGGEIVATAPAGLPGGAPATGDTDEDAAEQPPASTAASPSLLARASKRTNPRCPVGFKALSRAPAARKTTI